MATAFPHAHQATLECFQWDISGAFWCQNGSVTADPTFSAIAAAVSWLFALLTWTQYRQRGKLHQVLWAVGIGFFALGVTVEAIARAQGAWSDGGYRLWYFSGAMLGVAFLGQGTLHLLNRDTWTMRLLELLIVMSVIAGVIVLNAPADFSKLATPFEPSGRAFAELREAGFASPRTWTIPFNLYGTFWLVGGALYSTAQLWRVNRARALGTLLIALAGVLLASTSTLNRFGITYLESLGRMVGVSVLFAGFLVTGLDASKFLTIRLPQVSPTMVFGVTGCLVALIAFFILEPGVWHVVQEYPGLVVIGGMILALSIAVINKARQRAR